MSRYNKNDFLADLTKEVEEAKSFAQQLLNKDESLLQLRPAEDKWSVLECIDHMLQASQVYTVQIKDRIQQIKQYKNDDQVKIGWLGGWLASSMRPKEGEIKNKMGTMGKLKPGNSLNTAIIQEFIQLQGQLLDILNESKNLNLNKPKLKTAIGSLLKLRLGEALNFVIALNTRHIQQAKNAMNVIENKQHSYNP